MTMDEELLLMLKILKLREALRKIVYKVDVDLHSDPTKTLKEIRVIASEALPPKSD